MVTFFPTEKRKKKCIYPKLRNVIIIITFLLL